MFDSLCRQKITLTEVHIKSNRNQHDIKVYLYNPSLVAAVYRVGLSHCSKEVTILKTKVDMAILGPHKTTVMELKAETADRAAGRKGSVCVGQLFINIQSISFCYTSTSYLHIYG